MEGQEKREMTTQEWLDKLHNERKTWANRLKKAEEEKLKAVTAVREVADLVIARACESFGQKRGDEYVLDILKPSNHEGKRWVSKVEQLDDGQTWRIRAKEIDISM